MSIQQNLNQAVAIGGALYSQSATAELRKTAALEKREVAKIDKAMAALDANREETYNTATSMYENNPKSKIAKAALQAGRERTAEITDKRNELAERKAEITGDYSDVATVDVYQRAMEIANESAQAKREAKRKQMEK